MTKDAENFYLGVLVALQVVVVSHGETVIGNDIFNSVGWDGIKRLGKAQGGVDAETIRKLEKYRNGD